MDNIALKQNNEAYQLQLAIEQLMQSQKANTNSLQLGQYGNNVDIAKELTYMVQNMSQNAMQKQQQPQ